MEAISKGKKPRLPIQFQVRAGSFGEGISVNGTSHPTWKFLVEAPTNKFFALPYLHIAMKNSKRGTTEFPLHGFF